MVAKVPHRPKGPSRMTQSRGQRIASGLAKFGLAVLAAMEA
jgi:hypothetical protein